MKKTYISPKLSFESLEDDSGILIDGSRTELRDYTGGKTDGTYTENPVDIYDDVLTPPPSGPTPGTPDWDRDE